MGWNDELIAHYRKNNGVVLEGPFTGRQVLLLTTTGKSTGQPRTNPLVYTREGDAYVVIASKGGAPTHPDWYYNLLKHPEVTVEVGGERSARGPFPAREDPSGAASTTSTPWSTPASRTTRRRRRARSPRS